ncbi:MAG TPA: hypothetical protein VKQ08_06720, partial [Cyclobacteriaceae bacterium]|nr:hypothetical protein [Cyclobacteriaceae bacterium]
MVNYLQTVAQVSVKAIGVGSSSPFTDASIKVDGVEYNTPVQVPCRNNTINLVAFNNTTATPYPGISFYYNDQRGCGLQPSVINSFVSSEVETGNGDDLLTYVDNIQPSDSVVIYSVGDPSFSLWSSNVLTKLNALGISNSQITSLQDGEPVIIFSKKGAAPGSARVYRSSISPPTAQDVAVAGTISGRFSSGTMRSPLIGPAKKWIMFTARAKDVEASDQVRYSIYGVTLNGQETLIQSNVAANLDLSFVDPIQFPQLRVVLDMADPVNQTAVQLRDWFVLFESVADGLLFYKGPAAEQTVPEGKSFAGQYGFTNISSKSFTDSLQVRAEVVTTSKASSQVSTFKIKAPAPGDTTAFSFSINTLGKAGLNDVNVFVNPKIQPEQYYENNVIDLAGYLNVLGDYSPPLLDVTIDGRYVQNDDFVSPNPLIRIKLQDDNPFLFVTDTTHLNVFLSYPCAAAPCPFQRINFSRGDVQWSPALAGEDFTFNFHPLNLPEGTYTLQVNGTDEKGNQGPTPYEVTFQVKDETTLTLRSVYPNPSSGIFHFSFVLSGNVLPDNFSLQIYTANGKLVREFDMNEISNFIIGINEFAWNASQENQAGLFVYRLTLRANGKTAAQSGKLLLSK